MRKQDSIEFLWDELKSFLPANYTVDESVKILSILKQAKAMHKEECIKYYVDSIDYGDMGQHIRESFIQIAEKMYNETFGE